MPLLRKTLFDTSVPKDLKKTKLTGLHALLSLCVETALNRPIVPLEETIVDSLKPSVVFANDRSDAPIVYDSLQ